MTDIDQLTWVWWALLSAGSLGNIVALVWLARRTQATLMLVLAAVFTVVCAFRSIVPRADTERLVLFDHPLSSVALGRAVATVAELSFVAQWAIMVAFLAAQRESRYGSIVARAIVPLIVFAEICSWCGVLTMNNLAHVFEESTWTFTAALAASALVPLIRSSPLSQRRWLVGTIVAAAVYVAFMCIVDVPMYFSRWQAGEAAGRTYLSLQAGFNDAATNWKVSASWVAWRPEVAWMSLYFIGAVWMSLGMARAFATLKSNGR